MAAVVVRSEWAVRENDRLPCVRASKRELRQTRPVKSEERVRWRDNEEGVLSSLQSGRRLDPLPSADLHPVFNPQPDAASELYQCIVCSVYLHLAHLMRLAHALGSASSTRTPSRTRYINNLKLTLT